MSERSARPRQTPLGLRLATAARIVSRAFDDTLTAAGGSRPVWLVLMALKSRPSASQREIAGVVGVTDATLTHHLNAMEAAQLVSRRRDPANRRVHVVEITKQGEEMFGHLRDAASTFDDRLGSGLGAAEIEKLREVLAGSFCDERDANGWLAELGEPGAQLGATVDRGRSWQCPPC